jgi:hypothetical protein
MTEVAGKNLFSARSSLKRRYMRVVVGGYSVSSWVHYMMNERLNPR